MDNLDVKSLIEKYNDATLSDEERVMLESWYINEIKSNRNYQGLEQNLVKLDQHFMEIVQHKNVEKIRLWPKIAVAASLFFFIGLGVYFYRSKSGDGIEQKNAQVVDVSPAGDKAFLTLGNGKRIVLSEAANGMIATQSNVQITKTADGQLIYKVADRNLATTSSALTYNTIETPKGGKYEIALPDGTHVWMNAASSLKYPASFASLKERRVELLGEAYFEVAKDKHHPFIVITGRQEVKVLGTHFNINSYADEPETKTTLLEGSVNIYGLNHNESRILRPGQQASVSAGHISITDADIDQALSWKNGDFVFSGEDIKTVMRQVARWYNVDIEYQGDLAISGVVSTISRTKKLSQVLNALQINQGIHFKVEGRRVLVMP